MITSQLMMPGSANTLKDMKALARIPLTPMRSLIGLLVGRPFVYPEFGSRTVDHEDIRLTQRLLADPESWYDESSVRSYENRFASWNGSRGAYSFMGGRVALSAAISALGLKSGDEVIVPGYTCIVVPNAFSYVGINVRYCDIELDTYGPDIDSVRQNLSSRTRAILIHHLYGLVARDLEKIIDMARSRGILVIEDCAHATGATLHGRKVGNFGDVAFYSSEQSKVFSTFNGGIVVSNDEEILIKLAAYQTSAPYPSVDRVRALLQNFILAYRLQNDPWRGVFAEYYRFAYRKVTIQSTTTEEISGIKPDHYGQRMPAPLAILGLQQLQKIDRYHRLRQAGASHWKDVCVDKGLTVPLVLPHSRPVFLRFPLMVPAERKYDFRWGQREFGVRQGVWFSGELHPVRRQLDGCPNCALAVVECINLPTL
jgi:dTDP-4-amino-4,6-dideoxygalactose transaminase